MDLVRIIHERRVALYRRNAELAKMLQEKKENEKKERISPKQKLDEFELQLRQMPKSIFTRPAWKQIAIDICKKHDSSFEEIFNDNRRHDLVVIRQEIFYEIRHQLGMSLPEIGRRFNRDHTTVLHGIKKHEERMKSANVKKEK